MTHLPIRGFARLRLCCQRPDCKAVTELDLAQVEDVMKRTGGCCPVCGRPFTNPGVEGGGDVVARLARAVLALNALAPQVGIEIPVEVKTKYGEGE